MAMLERAAASAVALFLLIGPVGAQSPVLLFEGKVKQPQRWMLDDLKKMPAEHATVSYQTDRGLVTASFTGVLLWSLIAAAGGIDDSGKSAELRHAIRITAKDDYVVVTSTGEIAPDFGGKAALVADSAGHGSVCTTPVAPLIQQPANRTDPSASRLTGERER